MPDNPESPQVPSHNAESTFSRVGLLRLSLTVFFLLFYAGYITVLLVSGGHPGGAPLLYIILAGMLGGAIDLSRQIPLISRQRSTYSVLSVIIWKLMASGILAILLYCIFAADIIQGALFPKFQYGGADGGVFTGMEGFLNEPTGVGPKTNLDMAKVLVWSFVAGYSEKFVTAALTTLEKQSEQNERSTESE